jgi:hypothetical protein
MFARFFGLSAVAVLTIIGATSEVSASLVYVTYTGVMASGTDISGIFGPAYSNLSGSPFTVVYTVDLAKGFFYDDGHGFEQIYGGSSTLYSSPISAVLTINDTNWTFSGDYYSKEYASNPQTPPYDSSEFIEVYGENVDTAVTDQLTNNNGSPLPGSLSTPFSYVFDNKYTISSAESFNISSYGGGAHGVLQSQCVSVSLDAGGTCPAAVPAVPIPPAFPLFVGAVGGLWIFGRQRVRSAAKALSAHMGVGKVRAAGARMREGAMTLSLRAAVATSAILLNAASVRADHFCQGFEAGYQAGMCYGSA